MLSNLSQISMCWQRSPPRAILDARNMSQTNMETRRGRVAVRPADAGELDQLARVWYDAWQDAHAAIVPAALTRLRTLESFRVRLQADLQHIRVVGPAGDPVAFSIVKGDELY